MSDDLAAHQGASSERMRVNKIMDRVVHSTLILPRHSTVLNSTLLYSNRLPIYFTSWPCMRRLCVSA